MLVGIYVELIEPYSRLPVSCAGRRFCLSLLNLDCLNHLAASREFLNIGTHTRSLLAVFCASERLDAVFSLVRVSSVTVL